MDKDQVRQQFREWLRRWLETTNRPAALIDGKHRHFDNLDLYAAFQSGYIQATSDATMKLIEARPQAVAP